ncbi:spermidine synthase [Streptomyces zagrosensis]
MGALHGTPGVGERPVGEGSGGRAFGPAVLIGGLGVGFSLLEAVADHRWGRIVVVEREQAVIEWHLRGPLGALSAQALADPRTEILHTDLVAYLRGAPAVSAAYATPAAATPPVDLGPSGHAQRYDALCLDIDNGPDWTVTEDNGGLYSPAGLAACRERLNPGGVLAIWSAQPSFEFEEALRNAGFTSVRTEEIIVARGVPDVVHLAIRGA